MSHELSGHVFCLFQSGQCSVFTQYLGVLCPFSSSSVFQWRLLSSCLLLFLRVFFLLNVKSFCSLLTESLSVCVWGVKGQPSLLCVGPDDPVMRWTSRPCSGRWLAPGPPAPAAEASSAAHVLLAHSPSWPTPAAELRFQTIERHRERERNLQRCKLQT